MNKQLRFGILFLFVALFGIRLSYSQSAFASEEELKQQALKLFEDDEFEEAYPLYSQLASIYPKDPNYNYRLGVCMLYASDDKEKPIPFLEYAAKRPEVEKEVFFYLAKAYHLNYRFDDAITKYIEYEKVASESKSEKLQVERQIEMCRNGKKLLRNITDLLVLDKKELSRADFYRAYDISDIGGKLLAKPDEESFKTPLDKKKKEKSIIYLATNNNQVFFSSYGDDASHGKDIYIIRKLPNGEWSKPQTLGYPVNTEYDEDFPFLHPNGKVLYFCSKGHNSMGGYDIFKTTLNEETNTWNKPVNMDFPINTPDDDILYVTNEDEKEAFFSSARSSKTGKTAVFHINVERRPIDVAIIKGAVVKNRENQALDVKITVKDLGDNTILGIYNSKAETGGYLINLPNGGRFMYTVEATGFNTQSEVVVLPTQYEFKPLKQEISYEVGTDKLIVKNLFDEPVDDQSYLLALNFIKEKSKLEAGPEMANNNKPVAKTDNTIIEDNSAASAKTTDGAAKTTDAKTTDGGAAKTNPPVNLSNDAIVKIAYDDAKDAQKEAKELQEQADIALNMANQKNELAQDKMKEAAQLMADANNMTDNIKKQTAIDESNQARTDAEILNQETVAAFNIAKKLSLKAAAKDEEADLSMQYAKDLEAAVKSKNPAEALAKLEEQEKKLEELSEKNGNAEPDNIAAGLKIDADNKKRELDKAIRTSEDIKQEIADNETLIGTLQADADKTKKDDLKKGLLDQIEGLKADNEQSRKDLELNEQKVAKVQKEYNGIKNEMELVSNVVDKSKTGSNEDAAASVAAIDKTKLEQQVNEIRSNTDNTVATTSKTGSTDAAVKTSDSGTKTTDVAVKTTDAKTDNPADVKTDAKTADNVLADNTTGAAGNKADNAVTAADNTIVETKMDYKQQYADQLAAADNAVTPLERETKKADVYKSWTDAISTDLAEKKQLAKTEKDKNKKKELNTAIAALEKELKEKQQEEKTSVASVEKLKKEQAALADNAVKTTGAGTADPAKASGDNTVTSTDAGKTTSDNTIDNTSIAVPTIANINATYSEQLAAADNTANAADREKAKADVLTNWAKAIDVSIEKQKKDMAASDDPEMKALLAKKISDAEILSKEKKQLAAASLAKTGDQGTVAVNKTGTSSPDNTVKSTDGSTSGIVKPATENMKPADGNTGDVAKTTPANTVKSTDGSSSEIAKSTTDNTKPADGNTADAAKTSTDNTIKPTDAGTSEPVKSTDAGVVKTSDNPTKSTDGGTTPDNTDAAALSPVQKLDQAIAAAEKSATELERETKKKEAYAAYVNDAAEQIEAKQLVLKAEKNKAKKNELTSEIAALEADMKEKQQRLDAVTAKVTDLEEQKAAVADNAKSTNALTNTKFSAVSEYSNALAIEKATKAAAADKEAEQLAKQANDLKEQAAEKTKAADKEVLYSQANELTKQSDAKKTEALQLSSEASKAEYTANRDVLEQLAAASANNKSDDVSMAEMMKDEAKIYFEKAERSRELAGNVTSEYDKLAALEDAAANDKIALEKQKKATEIYKKYNPGFVAKNTTAPVVADNTVKSTDAGTSEPLRSSDGGVAKTTDNPVKSTDEGTSEPVKSNDTGVAKTTDNSVKSTDAGTSEPVRSSDAGVAKTTDNPVKSTDAGTSEPVKSSDAGVAKTTDAGTSDAVKTATDNTIASTDVAKTNSGAADALPVTEKFVRTTQPVYSAAKPIPVNEKLPEGLVYKVQIGAFRNPIDPETFSGMSPLTAETTPQGLTRYTAGLFTKFGTANKVKEEIRGLGYKDAFVVAFLNGKRISISEASRLTGETAVATNTSGATDVKTTPDNTAVSVPVKTNVTAGAAASKDIAAAENVAVIGGLFYTVQVGVYSQPITSAKLYNIQPLYTERTANGYLRYNTGIYNNTARANEARNIVVGAGVKDAFVTAYYQGKRITLPQAAEIEKQGSAVFSTAPGMNQLPTVGGTARTAPLVAPTREVETEPKTTVVKEPKTETTKPVSTSVEKVTTEPATETTTAPVTEQPPVVNTELKSAVDQNNTMPVDPGVVYKVQIGAFKDEVPLSIANQFLKIAGKGIKNYKDDNGLTIYTVGNLKSYEEASRLKAEIALTVTDAFIVAYNNGKKISIDEAKTLQSQ